MWEILSEILKGVIQAGIGIAAQQLVPPPTAQAPSFTMPAGFGQQVGPGGASTVVPGLTGAGTPTKPSGGLIFQGGFTGAQPFAGLSAPFSGPPAAGGFRTLQPKTPLGI